MAVVLEVDVARQSSGGGCITGGVRVSQVSVPPFFTAESVDFLEQDFAGASGPEDSLRMDLVFPGGVKFKGTSIFASSQP